MESATLDLEIMTEAPPETVRPLALTKRVPHTPQLLAKLSDLLSSKGANGKAEWSLSSVAKKLGINHAYVSIYARQEMENAPEFPGNMAYFEQKLADFMNALDEKRKTDETTFDTAVSRSLAKFVTGVRSVNGIGVLHGEAGLGKTIGVARYRAANPLTIAVDAWSWCAGKDAMIRAIFKKVATHGYNRKESRAEWLVEKLKGHGGVLIIDNAHKLTMGAYQFLFDLQDLTEIPIVLVGNPAIIDKLRSNDQLFSRVGMHREVGYKTESLATAVDALLQRELPEHAASLRQLAIRVAKERGHLRSLKNHLRVTKSFLESPEVALKPARDVFASAHEALIHESYRLTEAD